MRGDIIAEIVDLWSDINPVAGYTSGHRAALTTLLFETPEAVSALDQRIAALTARLPEIADPGLRETAGAVLLTQKTQLALARPSGAGPSGTGAGGVYAAADGMFYLVLKGDSKADWVADYLGLAAEMVVFETKRWKGRGFTVEVRKECLDTVTYANGTLDALQSANPALCDRIAAVKRALESYKALFFSEALASDDFSTFWPAMQKGDSETGPTVAEGYPGTLHDYYTLGSSASEVELLATGWLQLDMPVTLDLAQRVGASLGLPADSSLQTVWDAMSRKYAVDFTTEKMQAVLKACNDFGQQSIIGFTPADRVLFEATPSYLVNLVTGGEDFAIDYLTDKPYSQLYLTASKNTSLLTMINILVHEASHGFNFVMSAREAGSPLLSLNTPLEVPMTEGQAFYREYQYYAAAAALLEKPDRNPVEQAYLDLYGDTDADRAAAILAAQLETYIWRVIRYIRALCDVRVNGGKVTYTDFIAWSSDATGLEQETLHGECFTFLASPGYAPCYAAGGAVYGFLQTKGLPHGVPQVSFNTCASAMGFHSWRLDQEMMQRFAEGR